MDQSVSVLEFAEARASEIASLMHEVSTCDTKKKSWFQRMPHYMRRRNASQNPKRVPRKLQNVKQMPTTKAQSKSKKHKKRPKSLQEEYASRSTPEGTWLETHIWHAKRFKMDTLWGYRLPRHSNDKKLGSSHKAAINYCMIQDLSYYCCIELIGSQDKLLTHLSALSDASSGQTFASKMFLDGTKEGHTFLYYQNYHPFKAIGPVTFLWEPSSSDENSEMNNISRKLWIWCHPSFYDELVQVLINVFDFKDVDLNKKDNSEGKEIMKTFSFCCKLNLSKTAQYFQKEKKYFAASSNTNMNLLKNSFARHRLIGPMSQRILARVMKLAEIGQISCNEALKSENGNNAKKFKKDDDFNESTVPESADHGTEEIKISSDNIGESMDPDFSFQSKKLWWESYYMEPSSAENSADSYTKQRILWNTLKDIQSSYFVTPRSVIGLTVRDPRINSSWKMGNESNSSDSGKVRHPIEFEELFSPCVSASPLWNPDIRNEVTATKLPESFINAERAKCIGTPDLGRTENRVPILLIHQPGLNGFGSGWDVILPMGWSLEFWKSYERSGGSPSGLRDLHFVNLELGRPNFPCSFPDTAAGATYEEKLRFDSLKELYKHPKRQRPNFSILAVSTPFFICWKTLVSDWEKELPDLTSKLFLSSEKSTVPKDCLDKDDVISSNDSSVANISKKEFYVLRKTNELFRLCDHMNRVSRDSKAESEKLKQLLQDFLMNSLRTQTEFSKSLILIKVKCLNKGTPSTHAGIYLPSNEDLQEVKNNRKFCGPTEPHHSVERNDKSLSKGNSKSEHEPETKDKEISDNLKRPIVERIISNSTRKMIGYMSEGGFSNICGHGFGIGHCSSLGFLMMLKQCLDFQLRPLVLWREQHSFTYRVANIEIIENYL